MTDFTKKKTQRTRSKIIEEANAVYFTHSLIALPKCLVYKAHPKTI